ncbi:hypothetical protein MAM1_0330c09750 [Mucor ambiguus]|uniref:Uncharacterized protein n=1 Tax=Mucor ambiguus TaxID=91626 RepID=A0A0C9N2F8_9FUNG|nr:hypothetical protein MAM1_0330c09750 [Mucor ambiguus]
MEIVVSANNYTEWGKKFKSGIINLQCDVDGKDLGRKPSNGMFNFDTYRVSVNFQHCSYTNTSEDSI